MPEVAWNDDSSRGLSASGGGASNLVKRPSWQAGVPGIPSGSMRLVPDVSLYSSPGSPGYLYCTSDQSNWNLSSAPVQQASCNSGFRDSATGYLTAAGGTSFAAPIFAGMVALINQKAGYTTGQGLVNPTLYTLAGNASTYASAFHDTTSGNNNCLAGPSFCSATTGFSAAAGYDEVTGLGSVDLNNLAGAWPVNSGASASLVSTTTTVVPSNATPRRECGGRVHHCRGAGERFEHANRHGDAADRRRPGLRRHHCGQPGSDQRLVTYSATFATTGPTRCWRSTGATPRMRHRWAWAR